MPKFIVYHKKQNNVTHNFEISIQTNNTHYTLKIKIPKSSEKITLHKINELLEEDTERLNYDYFYDKKKKQIETTLNDIPGIPITIKDTKKDYILLVDYRKEVFKEYPNFFKEYLESFYKLCKYLNKNIKV